VYEYTTVKVEDTALIVTVSTTGNVEPTEQIDVGSEVSGTLSEVFVDYDDVVKQGMVLAKIDTTKLDASYRSAQATYIQTKASLIEAKATLVESEKAYKRGQELFKATKGLKPSQKDRDTLYATYERAKARVMSAQAQLTQANENVKTNRYNLDRAIIISPIDGIILDREVDAGQTVVAAMQTPLLFTIAKDLTKMKLLVSIDEADVGSVKAGQKATFTVDAYPSKSFEATITKVRLNAQVINSVVTYDAELTVDNSELLLRPGMTASAEIVVQTVESKTALIVPNAALRFTPKEGNVTKAKTPTVWIMKEGKPEAVKVTVQASDGIKSAITSDQLSVGEGVITKAILKAK